LSVFLSWVGFAAFFESLTAVQASQNKEQMALDLEKQAREIHAKGVDSAFKHAHAAQQLKTQKTQQNQPKKEKPTKGD